MKERNDVHGDEETLEQLRRRPEQDPDDDAEAEREFWSQLEREVSAKMKADIKEAATPEQFRREWKP